MSYQASDIIQINAQIRPAGLGVANFAKTVLFVTKAEAPVGFEADTFRKYSSMRSFQTDFTAETEAYQAANLYLGGTPATREMWVYVRDDADTSWPETLGKARNQSWWYATLLTKTPLSKSADVLGTASWCEANNSLFVNSQTGEACDLIRDVSATDDIASQLTKLGYRHTFTAANAEEANAGNALLKHYAAINYGGVDTMITGEGKKSPGVPAENLTDTVYAAMESDKKKAVFYTAVENNGSTDNGRWINTRTHSTYGEYIDDVVGLDAMINGMTVALYNFIFNQPRKLPQTPVGQAALITATRAFLEQYVRNGFLGPRIYIDPDTGLEAYTIGYEILTTAEDILTISDVQRDNREAASMRIRVFRAGAIHKAIVDIDIY